MRDNEQQQHWDDRMGKKPVPQSDRNALETGPLYPDLCERGDGFVAEFRLRPDGTGASAIFVCRHCLATEFADVSGKDIDIIKKAVPQ